MSRTYCQSTLAMPAMQTYTPPVMPAQTTTLSFRAERELVERLETLLEQMKTEIPGARLKLSDAIRATIISGLTVRERPRRKAKR